MAVSTYALELLWLLLLGATILLPGKFVSLDLHPYLLGALFGPWLFHKISSYFFNRNYLSASDNPIVFGSRPLATYPTVLPMLLLVLWLSINFWSSADRLVSWVAVGYLLFGIALYYFFTSLPTTHSTLTYLAGGIGVIGGGLAMLFPFIIAWKPQFRLFYFPLYTRLQALQLNIGETVHANVLAGALVLTLPVMMVLLIDLWRRRVKCRWTSLAAIGTILIFIAIILSQSRGGYLATVVALATMLLLYWPRLGYLTPLLLAGIVVFTRIVSLQRLLNQFSTDGSLGGWAGRIEIWQTSLFALSDFAFTGIGIGTFTSVIPLLYPLSFPIESYPHAHNLFLQIGLDLGIPGLIAYLALLITLVAMLAVTLHSQHITPTNRLFAIGASGSLAAMLVHGLLDAVTWGTKLAFVPWVLFALITQLFLHTQSTQSTHKVRSLT